MVKLLRWLGLIGRNLWFYRRLLGRFWLKIVRKSRDRRKNNNKNNNNN